MPRGRPPHGLRWEYTGLRVHRLERSIRFYRVLGFREVNRGRMDHGGVWVGLRFPGATHELELNYYPRGSRFYTPFRTGSEFDHFGFLVEDIAGWVRRLRRAHLPIVADWSERGWRLVYTRDPDGNWIELGARVPRTSAGTPRRSHRVRR